jgi:hypothetical protein
MAVDYPVTSQAMAGALGRCLVTVAQSCREADKGSGESLIMLVFHDRFVNLMALFTGAFADRIDVHWRV